MHTSLPAWLALSAALFPTTTAFYPYSYGDDSTSSSSPDSRLRRTPQPSNDHANARSITLPIRRVPALASRDNAYNIVNSKDPSQENSVAIDQDGADLSYMVAVRFGDSTEEYHLLLDSAASNTWVMGQECTSTACKTHNTFGTGDSSTLKVCFRPLAGTRIEGLKTDNCIDARYSVQCNLWHGICQRHSCHRYTAHRLAHALSDIRACNHRLEGIPLLPHGRHPRHRARCSNPGVH